MSKKETKLDVLECLPSREEVISELFEITKRARHLRSLDKLILRIEREREESETEV
jgi:hypothetical protein